jgi:hypothetical protein
VVLTTVEVKGLRALKDQIVDGELNREIPLIHVAECMISAAGLPALEAKIAIKKSYLA